MNKVTYLSHSGFVVANADVVMVFDYCHDPSHALTRLLDADENLYKPVVFFDTHYRRDRRMPDMFEIAQNHKRVYVMSNDIPAKVIPKTLDVAGMSAGDYIEELPGGLSVRAYGSTDRGVSFLVTTKDGEKIFYAGDLNDWHWVDLPTLKEQAAAHSRFEKLVHRVASDNPEIDIAMFPVDTRLGTDYAAGARYFLDNVKVEDFFPMHFDGDPHKACDFAAYAPKDVACHCLYEPGESITLGKMKHETAAVH